MCVVKLWVYCVLLCSLATRPLNKRGRGVESAAKGLRLHFGGESSDFILSLFSSGQIYVHCGTKKDRTTIVVRSIICAVIRGIISPQSRRLSERNPHPPRNETPYPHPTQKQSPTCAVATRSVLC